MSRAPLFQPHDYVVVTRATPNLRQWEVCVVEKYDAKRDQYRVVAANRDAYDWVDETILDRH